MADTLNSREQSFVAHRLQGRSGAEAARLAGYGSTYQNNAIKRIEEANPKIKAAIEAAREEVRKKTVFDTAALVEQLFKDVEAAREARQYNSVVKAWDLISVLLGLKLERMSLESPVNVREALDAAKARAGRNFPIIDCPPDALPPPNPFE